MQNSNSKATTFTLFAHLGLHNSNYHNKKFALILIVYPDDEYEYYWTITPLSPIYLYKDSIILYISMQILKKEFSSFYK